MTTRPLPAYPKVMGEADYSKPQAAVLSLMLAVIAVGTVMIG